MTHMLYLKVPRAEGERLRKELLSAGVLSTEYPIRTGGGFVFLPVKRPFGAYEAVEMDAEKRQARYAKLKDALSEFLSPEELESVISSFDIIGDIAIVEIPDSLESRGRQIGEALLKVHKNVRAVFKKLSPMEGEFRVRRLERIAGEDNAETIYKESGIRMKLDVSKVYFSVRLATERARIAQMVKGGERVLVLFAGVGPFALLIGKKRPDAHVVAVELNPDAVRYMLENIALNRLKNVEAMEADARSAPLAESSFDRIVMPLPKSAHEFLPVAFRAVKDGGMVHFYTMVSAEAPFEEALEKAGPAAKSAGVSVAVASSRIVRPYSPGMVQAVLDLVVKKAQ
ncbi:MAG: class I SAM-dependent methyltransferase family protein [Candidatus Micrarchaeota archaeon]